MTFHTTKLGVLTVLVVTALLRLTPASGRQFTAKEIAGVFAHAAKNYPKTIGEPQGTFTLKQIYDSKKKVSNYYMQNDEGDYDTKEPPAFTRKKSDVGIKWLYIKKSKDRLYSWERQSIVVLRRVPKTKDLYSAMIIHFRLLTGNKIVYEWDDWRPRGYIQKTSCPCQLTDKFYRYCTNWTYCDYQFNIYEQADDQAGSDDRRRRGAAQAEQADDVRNRMPPGTKQTMGPFFWDLVDDEVEAGQLYMLLREELKKAPSKAVYEDEIGTVPFSGYGDCPYWVKPGDFDEASSSKSPMLLLLFLAKAVRMQCILPTEQDVVKDLISEKLMYWDPKRGDVFFNTTHKLTTSINIDDTDLDNVERALHIAAFSRIYNMLDKSIKNEKGSDKIRDAVSPLGKKIHRNTRMVVLMSIKIYEMIQTSLKQHAVKLVKRLVSNLKDSIMLNIQNFIALEKKDRSACEKNKDCAEKMKTIKKDQTQIVSLIYFFLFGFDPTTIKDIFDDEEGETFDKWDTLVKYGQFYEFHVKFLDRIAGLYFEKIKV